MSAEKPFSQACENNKAPILEKLAGIFIQPATVLEIGTGTGQHAVHFARHLPHIHWQPSDHPANSDLCLPWLEESRLPNLHPPLALDVCEPDWSIPAINGVFSANTAHIMAWHEVECMFAGIGRALGSGEAFCLYGPFKYSGVHTSESNAQFDRYLNQRNPVMGIRDMDDLEKLAESHRMTLEEDFQMPANNRLLVWRRQ
ncbi:DUF938 domain-containing protein [Marinobacter arenosus]|uniref:DUF938 domain-containing protein n=1 Tax=Marinobacter arenosus TaxID=2856822 RepID=UPI001C4CD9CF|nr:DUF938 domain-containing protein [Marinobacter arenosus]MBW0146085.1 DUF938 domain-containing protein [Marinobacter arenosus]